MWKSIFDVFILILVTYSCIYTILNNTFDFEQQYAILVTYWVVESFFCLDFFLSWFQGFRDVEEQKIIFEFKKIAKRYLNSTFRYGPHPASIYSGIPNAFPILLGVIFTFEGKFYKFAIGFITFSGSEFRDAQKLL